MQHPDRHGSNHVCRVVEVHNQPQLIQKLIQIEKVLSSNGSGTIQVYPYDAVSEGQWDQVIHGPFKGVTGRIIRKDQNFRLALSVETVRQAIFVSIDASQVTPIHP